MESEKKNDSQDNNNQDRCILSDLAKTQYNLSCTLQRIMEREKALENISHVALDPQVVELLKKIAENAKTVVAESK